MELIKYCFSGMVGGVLLNITRILQNWAIAFKYNNMSLGWSYLRVRIKVQTEIFLAYIIIGLLCGITLYLIKHFRKEKNKI